MALVVILGCAQHLDIACSKGKHDYLMRRRIYFLYNSIQEILYKYVNMPGVPNIGHLMSLINHTSHFLYSKVFYIFVLHLSIYRRLRSRFNLRNIKPV